MGSGSGNGYSGTRGGSQPYAPLYNVVQQMLNKDKTDEDIYEPKSGYFKNPTASKLSDTISGSVAAGGSDTAKFYYYWPYGDQIDDYNSNAPSVNVKVTCTQK